MSSEGHPEESLRTLPRRGYPSPTKRDTLNESAHHDANVGYGLNQYEALIRNVLFGCSLNMSVTLWRTSNSRA